MRHGLRASWVRTPDRDASRPAPWATLRDFLVERLAADADVDRLLAEGRFVDAGGRPIAGGEPYAPNALIWFHRDLRPETEIPFDIEVLYRDERIIVVDKPHFLATTPRGRHIMNSVVARARDRFDLPDLGAAHRLDRATAGVLVLTTERRWRASYQGVFEARAATKIYEALAPVRTDLHWPRTVESHIEKVRGTLQARERSDREPNARTVIELVEVRGQVGRYRLRPTTGRTHQLRVHLFALGIPILGDPLYPRILEVAEDDFSSPLQLVARELAFTDPIDGTPHAFVSRFPLQWP